MVDYIKRMPTDIQEMIFSSYFKRHVLKEMVKRYFPHLVNVKSDKEFQLFKKQCIINYKDVCKVDVNFKKKTCKMICNLMDNNIKSFGYNKYITFIELLNFLAEKEVNLGFIYGIDLFMSMLYKRLHEPSFISVINPCYYVLLFNEIPVNQYYRGCY
jgi:hypothetical protein